MSYTLAEMENVTGAARRALQFWTDLGVILAEADTDRQAGACTAPIRAMRPLSLA